MSSGLNEPGDPEDCWVFFGVICNKCGMQYVGEWPAHQDERPPVGHQHQIGKTSGSSLQSARPFPQRPASNGDREDQ